MARPRRNTNLSDLKELIKESAWKQISEIGAPTLSLRAIARELQITAPAIYNYFPRRDDLVTALVIETYTSFGDSQLDARDQVSSSDPAGRLKAIGRAYRTWAIQNPQRYQLIFGTPIPGYSAPAELTMPSAVRSLSAIVSVLQQLKQGNKLRMDDFPGITPGFEPAFEVWKKIGSDIDINSISIGILFWTQVHGLVSLEIAGNLPPYGPGGDALFEYLLDMLSNNFIKP